MSTYLIGCLGTDVLSPFFTFKNQIYRYLTLGKRSIFDDRSNIGGHRGSQRNTEGDYRLMSWSFTRAQLEKNTEGSHTCLLVAASAKAGIHRFRVALCQKGAAVHKDSQKNVEVGHSAKGYSVLSLRLSVSIALCTVVKCIISL